MKSILLASASIIGFAGVAAADVTFGGSATLGFNDTDQAAATGDVVDQDNTGFYFDSDLNVTFSAELDGGLTAGATFSIDLNDDDNDVGNLSNVLEDTGYVLFLESGNSGMYFGDTLYAAETHWSAVGDMEQDGFSEADGETVLRADANVFGFDASVSYYVNDENAGDDLEQLSLGASGTLGNFTMSLAYQEETTSPVPSSPDEIFGISVGTAFAGADVSVGYVTNNTTDENSTGIRVSYPLGPVTATAYYVDESNGDANIGVNLAYAAGDVAVAVDYQDDQGTELLGIEGSFAYQGAQIFAGYLTEDNVEDKFYIGAEYDLGGGASVLFSYADADDEAAGDDDVGAQGYQVGTTIQVSFEF
ncbi:MAG: porin [Paracoccaceae bacterium]